MTGREKRCSIAEGKVTTHHANKKGSAINLISNLCRLVNTPNTPKIKIRTETVELTGCEN